jgi:signal transduction histidine kinase
MSTIAQPVGGARFDPLLPSARRDLLVVFAVTVVTFVVASLLELNERILAFTRPHELYQLDELPITFLAMIVALAWFSWRRSRQVIEQANLRIEAQRELADALQENRLLSQRYLEAQEEERRLLARELHDELGQSLNAIKVDAVSIRDQSRELPTIQKSAQAIIEVSSQVYDTVRSLMRQLRPVALDELGLAPAVQYGIEQWQRRHGSVKCEFSADGKLEGLDEKVNITVYRLVQECLTNVAKHAGATRVKIGISRTADGSGLRVGIADDGKGFDPSARRQGLGLVGLRERVEALGGRFELESSPGAGTRIEITIPLGARQ